MQSIEENDYWHLCERPQDVVWLSDYWSVNKRLGKYAELIENNINNKIEDLDKPKSGELTKHTLHEGAEKMIAAAIVLSKKSFIALPEDCKNIINIAICKSTRSII